MPCSIQRPDGSWYGNWGVCFTYGTWFGCEALAAVGESYASSASARSACAFLLQKQRSNGGWGESYLSCQNKVRPRLQGAGWRAKYPRQLPSCCGTCCLCVACGNAWLGPALRCLALASSVPSAALPVFPHSVIAPFSLFLRCLWPLQVYSQLEGETSHAVNTAWALLALLAVGYEAVDCKPLHAAARCLLQLQQDSGDWPQQHISGVFNRNCMITYANYRCGSEDCDMCVRMCLCVGKERGKEAATYKQPIHGMGVLQPRLCR
jgi:hypothetical protein